MSDPAPADPRRPLIYAAGAVVVAAVVAAVIFVNRSNQSSTPPSGAQPAQTQISFADCTMFQFGQPLQPLNPPADIHSYPAEPAQQIDASKLYQATIVTDRGTIVLCLQPNLAPRTVNDFVALARNHFYDGLRFHRVEPDFVIQGGDPKGDGTGGPGYTFADEPVHQQYVDGAVAMANSGPNTNGSQFFIDTADDATRLAPNYNLFGKVESGLDVAHKVVRGDVMRSVTVTQQQ